MSWCPNVPLCVFLGLPPSVKPNKIDWLRNYHSSLLICQDGKGLLSKTKCPSTPSSHTSNEKDTSTAAYIFSKYWLVDREQDTLSSCNGTLKE